MRKGTKGLLLSCGLATALIGFPYLDRKHDQLVAHKRFEARLDRVAACVMRKASPAAKDALVRYDVPTYVQVGSPPHWVRSSYEQGTAVIDALAEKCGEEGILDAPDDMAGPSVIHGLDGSAAKYYLRKGMLRDRFRNDPEYDALEAKYLAETVKIEEQIRREESERAAQERTDRDQRNAWMTR